MRVHAPAGALKAPAPTHAGRCKLAAGVFRPAALCCTRWQASSSDRKQFVVRASGAGTAHPGEVGCLLMFRCPPITGLR